MTEFKPLEPPQPWMRHAACAAIPKDVFYPGRDNGPGCTDQAKAICAGCPVRTECLEYAVTNHELYGVWGGMTQTERRALRAPKRPHQARCGTESGYNRHRRVTLTEPCQACREAHAEAHRRRNSFRVKTTEEREAYNAFRRERAAQHRAEDVA